jgi:EAL domain-containing protein (putative c-di-GMP-specific phosphodiesterase class I)
MFDDLDLTIRAAIHNLMLVLYEQGITEIHTGGMMRLLGVSDDVARQYDDERVILDDNFVKYVEEINTPRPADQPLH